MFLFFIFLIQTVGIDLKNTPTHLVGNFKYPNMIISSSKLNIFILFQNYVDLGSMFSMCNNEHMWDFDVSRNESKGMFTTTKKTIRPWLLRILEFSLVESVTGPCFRFTRGYFWTRVHNIFGG